MLPTNKLYKVAIPEMQYCFRPNIFMWSNRILLFGPLHHLDFHAMGSVAINIGLYQPFLIKTKNESYQPYRCAIIPAGCKHELNAYGNIVACLIIEKNSTDFINFKKQFPFHASTITNISNTKWVECMQKIYLETLP